MRMIKLKLIPLLLITVLGFFSCQAQALTPHSPLYTADGTRLRLVASAPGKNLNLLLVPGGPGMGSEYLESLAKILNIPGDIWLVDLPNNGNNLQSDVDYKEWSQYLLRAINSLDNAVVLGHSYGGMLLLAEPKFEKQVKGLILLSTIPVSMSQTPPGVKPSYIHEPEVVKAAAEYNEQPSDGAYKTLLQDLSKYYFCKKSLSDGKKILDQTQYNAEAFIGVGSIFMNNYKAHYIPKVPTLILGGLEDPVAPQSWFSADSRFKKPNIIKVEIEGASHFPWVEEPKKVADAIEHFIKKNIVSSN